MYRSVLPTRTILQPYGAPSIAKRSYSSHMVAKVAHLLQRDGRSSGYPDGLLLARLLQIFFAPFSNSFLAPSPPFSIITGHSVKMKVWLALHTIVLSAGQSHASFLSSSSFALSTERLHLVAHH